MPSGSRRARSASNWGAVLSISISMRHAQLRRAALAEGSHQQVNVVGSDALMRGAGFAPIPGGRRIAEPEQRQRRHAWVEILSEFARIDALFDDAFDDALVTTLDGADAPARGFGQEAALAQEGQREIEPFLEWREVLHHQARDFVRRVLPAAQDGARADFVVADAVGADRFQRGFFGCEVVVEAGLPDAEHVGDVLSRGSVVAALRENLGRRCEHFGGPALGGFDGARLHAGVFYRLIERGDTWVSKPTDVLLFAPTTS